MKTTLYTAVVIALTLAALIYIDKDRKIAGEIGSAADTTQVEPNEPPSENSVHSPELTIQDEIANAAEETNSSIDFASVEQRLGRPYDPLAMPKRTDLTEQEIQAFNELHILQFNPRDREVCSQSSDELSSGAVVTCKRYSERGEHPYLSMDLEELADLAYADAEAAIVIGRRTLEFKEALKWHIRAVALSGKPGPLMSLSKGRIRSSQYNKETDTEEPDYQGISRKAAIELVAQKLGDPRANPERWRNELANSGLPPDLLEQAKSEAESILSKIKQIQQQVGVSQDT